MNEKDLLQKIKEDADRLTPPASLQPEAVEKMLREANADTSISGSRNRAADSPETHSEAAHTDNAPMQHSETARAGSTKNTERKTDEFTAARKRKRSRAIAKYGSLAAVFALAVTALFQSQRITSTDSPKGETAVLEQSAAADQNETAAQNVSGTEAAVLDSTENMQAEAANVADTQNTEAEAANVADTQSAETTALQSDSTPVEESAPKFEEAFTYADSPEAIYNALYEAFYSNDTAVSYGTATADAELLFEESVSMDTGDAAQSSSRAAGSAKALDSAAQETGFSGTNLQEAGVDEGDIIKTDGTYIYILRQDLSLAIVKADGASSETVSVTSLEASDNASVREMYLDGDTLSIVLSEYVTSLGSDEDVYYTSSNRQARLITYDVSDRTAPVQTGSVTQEGSYETSRKNGPYIYVFTSYYPDLQPLYGDSTIMPRINGTEASAADVYLPETLTDRTYLVISSVDTASPGDILDSKILVSGASNYYVSTENIYIANETYASGQTMTEITKFHYADGEITGVAATSVNGYLNNSFSMNEYDGNLRVVSTYTGDAFNAIRDAASQITGRYYAQNWEEHNALYVLDETLQQIGAIEGLADGETIRSARFLGDVGYFVTFRQTDPLFSVDLSDPTDPQILGELKVSGFSSYLHFYGENLLLGIGYEADEETGITTGLKLSMFDISDPSNVTEVHRLTLPGITWCPAIDDYKAILVEPEKNVIGFFCDNRYLVFSYDGETGFTSELTYDFYSDMLLGQAEYNTMRGLYINDTFYLAGNTFLITFDMKNDFEKTGVLTIE